MFSDARSKLPLTNEAFTLQGRVSWRPEFEESARVDPLSRSANSCALSDTRSVLGFCSFAVVQYVRNPNEEAGATALG